MSWNGSHLSEGEMCANWSSLPVRTQGRLPSAHEQLRRRDIDGGETLPAREQHGTAGAAAARISLPAGQSVAMRLFRRTLFFTIALDAVAVLGAEVGLPPRPADAMSGSAFAADIANLPREAREAAVRTEIERGNVPSWWRRFVDVPVGEAVIAVSPDYLAVGSDDDWLLTPLTPGVAQAIADRLDCVLPTARMVDAIYAAAPLKLTPAPIPPSPAMTTAAVFAQHNATVVEQRRAALAAHPPGTLVAGHKKDVVVSLQLATKPGKVAIYGWHRTDGTLIQPLYLGHTAVWVDYSHGVRLVRRAMTCQGAPTTIDAVLADPARCAWLSHEGPVIDGRYGPRPDAAVVARGGETSEEMRFHPRVRAVINSPAALDPAKPVRLIIYAVPAGNTIEQTLGKKMAPGDDWHFDIQHIAAQTRWLRARMTDVNVVLACLQSDERSFVAWRRSHGGHRETAVEIVEALRRRYESPRITLTGHSAGGTFTFAYLEHLERIPDHIERIAFLDSNYAYDLNPAVGHAWRLAEWVRGASDRHLQVMAYEDHVALLNGKTFVSASGGTWGRSHAMLGDLAKEFPFTREDQPGGLQRHVALGGRVEFLLKENPEKAVLHTRQVELNGFIHAMLAGTERAGQGYVYLGPRAYAEWIRE